MRKLGTGIVPEAINNRGQVVGSCRKHACVWESGRLTLLDEGEYKTGAVDINERQQIVGWKMVVLSGLNPWWDVVLWTYKR